MHKKPRRLRVSIGGYMGGSFSVELAGKELRYEACGYGYEVERVEMIPVSAEQWAAFREALASIGVWKWEKSYPNPGVCDGTHWGVAISYRDARVQSRGDNSYPDPDGAQTNLCEEGDTFCRFLKAVEILIGGRSFA